MAISNLYILLSEEETHIKNDVDSLIEKGIFTSAEITSGSSLLVCISRDYLDLPNDTPAVMVRDQLSNVFCPTWRICATWYSTLLPIMNLKGDLLPTVRVMTNNKEIFDNMDYFLHLQRFDNREKMYLPDSSEGFVDIVSEIRREDIRKDGEISVNVLEMAGYDRDENNQVPGWIFQCASPWLTRVLDLYDISPKNSRLPIGLTDLRMTREELTAGIESPIILTTPKIGEDMRTCIIESFDVRKDLYMYSKDLLSRI